MSFEIARETRWGPDDSTDEKYWKKFVEEHANPNEGLVVLFNFLLIIIHYISYLRIALSLLCGWTSECQRIAIIPKLTMLILHKLLQVGCTVGSPK